MLLFVLVVLFFLFFLFVLFVLSVFFCYDTHDTNIVRLQCLRVSRICDTSSKHTLRVYELQLTQALQNVTCAHGTTHTAPAAPLRRREAKHSEERRDQCRINLSR